MRLAVLSLLCAVTLYGQTPIYQGVLQSDLNAAGYQILSANLSSYAGANMTWNVATGKFDATGGGGGGNVSNSGTPTANQLPIWTDATHIKGVTAVSGGTTGQVLKKNTNTDYDWAWATDLTGGGGSSTTGTGFWHNTAGALDAASRAVDVSTADITGNLAHTHLNSGTGASSTTFWRGDDTWATPAGAGGTPGGSNQQLQYNNSSAFGGVSGSIWDGTTFTVPAPFNVSSNTAARNSVAFTNTNVTSKSSQFTFYSSATPLWSFGNDGLTNGTQDFYIYDNVNASSRIYLGPAYQFNIVNASVFGWGPTGGAGTITADTGLYRNAAGVVEVDNGTAGSYRDLIVRNITINGTCTGTGCGGGAGVTSIATTSPITGGTITTTGTLGLNVGVDHAFTAAQSVTTSDTATNTVVDQLTTTHNSSGVIAANFGAGLLFKAQDSTTASVSAGEIQSFWTTATHSSNVSDFVFKLDNGSVTPATAASIHGAGYVDAAAGFQIAGAATSGKIMIGDGTKFVASTPTYPNVTATSNKILTGNGTNWVQSTPTFPATSVPGNGVLLQGNGTNWIASTATWPTANTADYTVTADGTNYRAYPTGLSASSVTSVSSAYSADTYLAGSGITVAAGDFKAQGQYHCVFDMTKTGAGAATPIIIVRVGTAGTTADAAICTLTFSAGTAAIDSGMFEVYVVFRTVGSGTSAVFQAVGTIQHQGGTTGLVSKSSDYAAATSSGFASNTATKIGLSFNGGTSFLGTNVLTQTQLTQP